MKKQTILLLLVFFSLIVNAFDGGKYVYYLDLTDVVDDKIKVILKVPELKQNELLFYMPKIVPGTYSIEDYGRLVSNFEAFDKKGRKLEVEKRDINSWIIKKAKKIDIITYWVDDSFDFNFEENEIFWPSGTNIEDGKNFVINTGGFFGYFDGQKNLPFEFNILRPDNFYGSTGLIAKGSSSNLVGNLSKDYLEVTEDKKFDTFVVDNYDHLIDSPLMYSEADTTIIKVSNTEVLIASYSPNKIISSKDIAIVLEEVLMAQNEYLGGKLPVDKYAFIFYFTDQPVTSYGALEHSYSSLYYIPESNIQQLQQTLRDFAAHEFFHIITPLTIHSKEIQSFDFNDPKISKHLWLYEGVTEYF
ncbi:MAG: hypothetical protein OEW75_14715, partial [Cyclobacteriaceae bacterium]|nr:hypothetical protein [Cyclobacteriaceae bacterium]